MKATDEQRRHHNYDSSHWRSIWGVCWLLSIMVYSFFAFLPRTGSQVGEHQANQMGRVGSVSDRHSNRVGSLEAYRTYVPADSSDSDISDLRSRVRVYDSPSLHTRHLEHVAHLAHLHWMHLLHEQRLAAAVTTVVRPAQSSPISEGDNDNDGGGNSLPVASEKPSVSVVPALGSYSCSSLEQLWMSQGGNSGEAFIAAEIARAESGGNPNATGPAGERGLWQISPDHGSLSTYDPVGNARAAISISGNGTNWRPWTTYTSGAYVGQCLYDRA